jgi:hypothetical protein
VTRRSLSVDALAFVFLIVVVCACSQTVVLEDPPPDGGVNHAGDGAAGGGGSDGGAAGGGAAGAGVDGAAGAGAAGTGDVGADGGRCLGGQGQALSFSAETPEVVVALDHSAAMNAPFGGDSSQWSSAVDALSAQVGAQIHNNQPIVRFAFVDFPDTASDCSTAPGCCSSDVTPTTTFSAFQAAAAAGCDLMSGCFPPSQRPTAYALSKAQDFLGNHPQTGPRYVLLVSDGPPSGCSGPGMSNHDCSDAIIQIEALKGLDIQTKIVSIGDASNTGCLIDLASAEGAAGAPFYYTASSPTDLTTVLTTITNTVAQDTCHLDLTGPPSAPDQILVLFDGVAVPRDASHQNGWDVNGKGGFRITLYGTACDDMMESGSRGFEIFDSCGSGHFGPTL